jgi:hypothetical protein
MTSFHSVSDGEAGQILKVVFLPDMNRARRFGWSEYRRDAPILSTADLGDFVVNQFVDLSARADRGELTRAASPVRRAVRYRFEA